MALIATHNFIDGDDCTHKKIYASSEEGKTQIEVENKKGEITILRARVVDGEYCGLYEEFYNNGQRQNLKICDGKDNIGTDIDWYKNGQIQADWNGGIRKSFFESGQIRQLKEVDEYGNNNNLCTIWYESGIFKSKMNYSNGELHGLSETWYEDGQRMKRANYNNGCRDGLYEEWYSCGQKKDKYYCKKDFFVGEYIKWYENGVVMEHIMYDSRGNLNGFYEINYKNGKPQIRAIYENNIAIEYNEFDNNGILIRTTEPDLDDVPELVNWIEQ